MSSLDKIISITIDRQTKAVAQKGFGTLLLLGALSEKPTGQTSRTRTYTADDFADDFDSTDATYKAISAYFSQAVMPEKIIVGYKESAETIADALDAIVNENGDFYAVATVSRTQVDQEAVATWVASKRRIAGLASADAAILTNGTTDIAAVLKAANQDRAFVVYNGEAATKYPEIALLGRMLPELPGSATYKFKTLVGIVADKLTGTQVTNLNNKKCNYYEEIGGVSIIEEGTMSSGEFIDNMIGVDWIHARMQEAIYSRLVNLKKVPYTNQGVDVIVNEMDSVLRKAVDQGILSSYTISKPDVKSIAFNDRVARILPDLKFEGILAGAVHTIKIQGIVTV